MKVLITGCNGFLGSSLTSYFSNLQFDVLGTSLTQRMVDNFSNIQYGDLRDIEFVRKLIYYFKPDIIINTVALVDLDFCEKNPKNLMK